MELYVFSISHFCEKAAWALDYLGCNHKRIDLIPGAHIITARAIAPTNTLPILKDGSTVIQGSSEIISYLSENSLRRGERHLEPSQPTPYGRSLAEWEQWIDEELGISIRGAFYAEMSKEPERVGKLFSTPFSGMKAAGIKLSAPLLASMISTAYGTSRPGAAEAHRGSFIKALDVLDEIYGSQEYFDGHGFSRLDLTTAALLGNIDPSDLHPGAAALRAAGFPDGLKRWLEPLMERPTLQAARRMYTKHRSGH